MYTRSYNTGRNLTTRVNPPPDYSGTALKVNQTQSDDRVQRNENTRQNVVSAPDNGTAANRRNNQRPQNDSQPVRQEAPLYNPENRVPHDRQVITYPFIPLSPRPPVKEEAEGSMGRPPFGNGSGSVPFDGVQDKEIKEINPVHEENHTANEGLGSGIRELFSGRGLEIDDLLLLGLIFLIVSNDKNGLEGLTEDNKQAVLMLAILFIAGL